MGIVKIVGIVALLVFLAAFIGRAVIVWFCDSSTIIDKVRATLGYVTTGAMTIAAVCGIIRLFA